MRKAWLFMREKLKSLPLTELKQIAKENHIKNVSTLRKAQLIDVILERLSPEQAQTPQTQNVLLEKRGERDGVTENVFELALATSCKMCDGSTPPGEVTCAE